MERYKMSKIAFVYPGQGAQTAGMGKDFYENSALVKEIFDKGSEILNLDLKELCFEENDRLDKTEYTQAAMVTACLAMTREVEARGLHADMTAGLSLGEYCAIAVAGGMSDMDAIRTVRARGIYMENAAPAGSGAMAAVLGMEASVIEDTIKDIDGVSIANYNCPGQIVITGEAKGVQQASEALKEAGARRVLPLNVSGPFHSPMMVPAGEKLKEVLDGVTTTALCIPYVANVNAKVIADSGEIKDLLVKQVSSSVRWEQSMETMIREGVDTFVEIGPGKTLAGFMRKINKNVKMYHIGTWEEAEKVCAELTGSGD